MLQTLGSRVFGMMASLLQVLAKAVVEKGGNEWAINRVFSDTGKLARVVDLIFELDRGIFSQGEFLVDYHTRQAIDATEAYSGTAVFLDLKDWPSFGTGTRSYEVAIFRPGKELYWKEVAQYLSDNGGWRFADPVTLFQYGLTKKFELGRHALETHFEARSTLSTHWWAVAGFELVESLGFGNLKKSIQNGAAHRFRAGDEILVVRKVQK